MKDVATGKTACGAYGISASLLTTAHESIIVSKSLNIYRAYKIYNKIILIRITISQMPFALGHYQFVKNKIHFALVLLWTAM